MVPNPKNCLAPIIDATATNNSIIEIPVTISGFIIGIFVTVITAFWAILPLISFFMFVNSPMPDVAVSHKEASNKTNKSKYGLMLCVICIFLGGASEVTMTNWISGYMENALHISKVVGDILGMALFAIFLGIGRTMYAKYGKNIEIYKQLSKYIFFTIRYTYNLTPFVM